MARGQTSYIYGYGSAAIAPVDLRKKGMVQAYYVKRWLSELQSMLKFSGLPETIPERDFKRLLQVNGFAVIPDPKEYTNGKPYAFRAGLGGEPDPYYMPTIAVISNPALDLSISPKIHEECVVIPHDSLYLGVLPMLNHYATLSVDADLSLYLASILSRAPVHISAQGDRSKTSADQYLKDLEAGNLGAIFEDGFLDGIKTNPGASATANNSITNLIEYRQYLKASRWNDSGLNANYNMKRESINEAEAQMNNDSLSPWVDDVLRSIRTGLDEANEKFGLNITVELGGAWARNQEKEEAQVDMMEKEAEQTEETSGEEASDDSNDEKPAAESV